MPVSDWTRPPGFPSVFSEPERDPIGPAALGPGEWKLPWMTHVTLIDSVSGSAMEDPPYWTFGLRSIHAKEVPVPPGPGINPYPNGYGHPPQFKSVPIETGMYGQIFVYYSKKTESDAWTFNNLIDPPYSVYREHVWPVGAKLDYEFFAIVE